MNQKENGELTNIVKHISTLNDELGRLDKSFIILQTDQKVLKTDVALIKKDIFWIRKIGYFISTAILFAVGKILFFD